MIDDSDLFPMFPLSSLQFISFTFILFFSSNLFFFYSFSFSLFSSLYCIICMRSQLRVCGYSHGYSRTVCALRTRIIPTLATRNLMNLNNIIILEYMIVLS